MIQKILVLLTLLIFVSPVFSQNTTTCQRSTGNPPPRITHTFVYDSNSNPNYERDAEEYGQAILDYLNSADSPDGLQDELIRSTGFTDPNWLPWVTAQVVQADMNNDQTTDVITNLNILYGTVYIEYLSLYACSRGTYRLLDTITNRQEGLPNINFPPTNILHVVDINNDQHPDIILDTTWPFGDITTSGIDIYEWGNNALNHTFSAGRTPGFQNTVSLVNFDQNPATLEMVMGSIYAFEKSNSSQSTHFRPVDEMYQVTRVPEPSNTRFLPLSDSSIRTKLTV